MQPQQRDDCENKMTFQEKIDYIDHEIRLLHQFCLQTGYSPQKINEFAEPFMNELNKTKRESYNRLLIIVSLIALFSGILGYGIAYHPSGQAAIRLTMVKVKYKFLHYIYTVSCSMVMMVFLVYFKQIYFKVSFNSILQNPFYSFLHQ